MKRLTKVYPTGFATLDAAQFPEIRQETIDREIRSFEPFAAAVRRLAEYEDKPAELHSDEAAKQYLQ